MIDFSARSQAIELMDDLTIQGPELERTLDEIAFINRTLGGYAPSLAGVKQLVHGRSTFSLLDVGTGSGDVPRRIARFARQRGVEAKITGIDLTETTIRYARQQSRDENIEFRVQDLFRLPDEPAFDVVHAAITLHHFSGESAVFALAKMYRICRLGVVINDLHRHVLAWGSIKLLTRALSRNRLIRHDAPLSVLRAFSREELFALARRANLPEPSIHWHPLFRWRVVLAKPGSPARAPSDVR